MNTLKVTIQKSGLMRYYSQLDLVRILERAARRTDLPFAFTQGFTPRLKISFHNGLKLGVEGDILATFYFHEETSFVRLEENLLPQLPHGLILKP
ncbi:MAG: DUF2344 domain-containing protein [Candidatus Omnitrophica bacterium]|nr:DUF2344 domain-containing protein [Candidatus Omnitrophota bacterium]